MKTESVFKVMKVVLYTLIVVITTLIIDGWISKPSIVYVEAEKPRHNTTADIIRTTSDEVVDITPYCTSREIIYTVQDGDSFWELAEKFYNDGNKYEVIMVENNTESLMPGDEIRIPIFEPIAEICKIERG